MSDHIEVPKGDQEVWWMYPDINHGKDENVDKLTICVFRVRAIPDIVIGFDGKRDGYVIGKYDYTSDTTKEFKEIAFISEYALEPNDLDQCT